MGVRGSQQRLDLQDLVAQNFGWTGSKLIADLALWQTAGESEQRQLAAQRTWLHAASSDRVSFIIEDRIYSRPPQPRLYKNDAYLGIPETLELQVWQDDGTVVGKTLRLRSVVVHQGRGDGGHYYTVVNERQSDGAYRLVTHDDVHVTPGDDLEAMARGARLVHYEAIGH